MSHQGSPKSSLVAQAVKNLPAMQEAEVRSMGWENPLEKEMATHSSILAWKIPWIEKLGGLRFMGSQRVGHNRATKAYTLNKLGDEGHSIKVGESEMILGGF